MAELFNSLEDSPFLRKQVRLQNGREVSHLTLCWQLAAHADSVAELRTRSSTLFKARIRGS